VPEEPSAPEVPEVPDKPDEPDEPDEPLAPPGWDFIVIPSNTNILLIPEVTSTSDRVRGPSTSKLPLIVMS
jgi:hypothetical protein